MSQESLFKCKECGHCCHGETTVSLNAEDLDRMKTYMKMSDEDLKKKYLRENANVIQMKIVDGHCIFYNGGCAIHPAKPWRCIQWPQHPSILHDINNFETIKESCPGIASNQNYDEFCIYLEELNNQR